MKKPFYFFVFLILLINLACKVLTPANTETASPNNESTPSEIVGNDASNPENEWATFSGTGNPIANDIALDNQDNIYVLEQSSGDGDGHANLALTKIDGNGNIIWSNLVAKILISSNASLVLDDENNIYVSANADEEWGTPINSFNPDGYYAWDVFVAKFNEQGSLLWNTFIGDNRSSTITLDTSNIVHILTLGGHNEDPTLVKLSNSGEILQNTPLDTGTPSYDYHYSRLEIDGNGNLYASGVLFNGKDSDYFVGKYLNSGELVWETIIGGDGDQDVHFIGQNQLIVNNNGDVFLHGYSNASWGTPINPFDGGYDYLSPDDYEYGFEDFIVKLDKDGSVLWHTFLSKSIGVFDMTFSNNQYLRQKRDEKVGHFG